MLVVAAGLQRRWWWTMMAFAGGGFRARTSFAATSPQRFETRKILKPFLSYEAEDPEMKVATHLTAASASGLGFATPAAHPPLSLKATGGGAAASSSPSSHRQDAGFGLALRPYDPDLDRYAIESICRDVYGGRDYLPSAAASIAADPSCRFLVLTDADADSNGDIDDGVGVGGKSGSTGGGSTVVACANARTNIQPGMSWLEAVRTCPNRRGRGLAGHLTRTLLNLTRREDGCELYSCTVQSNAAMRRVFDAAGMRQLHSIHQLKFDELLKLPGWASSAAAEGADADADPGTLLAALNAENLVSREAREQSWVQVRSRGELAEALRAVRVNGGIGYLPGLYELLSSQAVEASLRDGLVWKLAAAADDEGGDEERQPGVGGTSSSSCSNSGGGGSGSSSSSRAAVVALTKDEKIQSLRSPWVCSVAATEFRHFEGGLWHACCAMPPKRPFTVAVDGAVPVDDPDEFPLCRAMPFVEDSCLLFGSAPTSA